MKAHKNYYHAFQFYAVISIFCLANAGLSGQIKYNSATWGVNPMEFSRVGTAGFQFLKLPTNARAMGMGGILSSAAYGDSRSAFTNPASISDITGSDVTFNSMKWVADIQMNTVSAVHNLPGWGVVGLNLVYLNYGEMEITKYLPDEKGNMMPVTEGLGTFSAHDMAIGLSFSRRITDKLQLGGNLRYIEEQLDDAKTYTWSLDIGTLYWTGLGSLRISMLGKNFGPDAKFTSYQDRLEISPVGIRMPMMFVLGAAYDILTENPNFLHRLTIASEYIKPNDGPEKVNSGIEYFFSKNVYLRAGYRFNYDEESFTFGVGAEYSVADDLMIKVDYAYARLGRFSSASMLSAGVGF